ncbi:MAG: TolC family protein, partial [Candidatus Hinthialibacter sp.]
NLFLAKLSRIPDIGFGLNLIETGPARTAGIADSGKNPFMGLFSMNLPIWEQRTQALIKEKEAAEQAARQQAMNETNQIRMAVAKTFFAVDLTKRLTLLYQKTLLPQAEAVMKQAEIYFRNDQASFSNLIEVTLAYHNFQLAYHRALADLGQSIGRLEQVLGTTADTESNAPLGQE